MSAKQHSERGITMEMNKNRANMTAELISFDENIIDTTVLEMLEIYIDSGKSNHTYIAGDYTDYGYMGSDGVEYATIDEAIEAGAA